jgi:tRNA A58 N-methylase Trm61
MDQIRALRGDVDHHNDQAALAARLDVANRFLAALTAGAGSAAMSAATARTRSELGAFY